MTPKPIKEKPRKSNKLFITIAIIIIIVLIAAFVVLWLFKGNLDFSNIGCISSGCPDSLDEPIPVYSHLTGLEIANNSLNASPTFCVQIPNGSTDGARPQAGLDQASVVFEAIAETGITRFAAIFQNPNTGIIGPIRSLRPYYLDWDTPFDCTVVHDGGSPEALAAVGNGRYRNLDENFDYMWKVNDYSRLWNNVFTSPEKLLAFNRSHNYNTSSPKTFPRLTPTELEDLNDSQLNCDSETNDCTVENPATSIQTVFTNLSDYIVNYTYDSASNTYRRSYEGTGPHLTYSCPADITDFAACGEPIPVAPSAVVVMRVQEHTMSDNYHEAIQTTGQGVTYVFQNGTITEGTWQKSSQDSQLQFHDLAGNIIKLVPGQAWIAAVPQFGSVSWE